MSLEYLLDVAIQFDQQKKDDSTMEGRSNGNGLNQSTTNMTMTFFENNGIMKFDGITREYTPIQAAPFHPFLLPPTFPMDPKSLSPHAFIVSSKAEAARRRQLAIERRNAKRNIVPRHVLVEPPPITMCVDRNKTKNRISAASYRENRDKRVLYIQNEIKALQKLHPGLQSKEWVPVKKAKSAIREGETKEEYRKRTNRESAADSRYQQQQKLQYLTRELARLRALLNVGDGKQFSIVDTPASSMNDE
ncbi:hypothetical protein THRCLA_02302 [Thraustotheca clavata]|uniref:Uncharacterized protein n=1 Tax=Thraustotheca clavata TaxID=74557 RepID=A0A1W0A5N0_9STRA|nr:hypothetical protein THRCLA_02302 [Thraustotheca clavata]